MLEALAKVPLFSQLGERERRRLAKLCRVKRFEADAVVYEEGTVPLGLFLVTSGRIERYKGEGDTRVSLGTVAAGGVLGQLALIDEQPRATSAKALEETDCLLLTRDSFDTLVRKDPQIAWCLVPELAGTTRELLGRTLEAERARQAAAAAAAAREAEAATAEETEDDEDEEETEGWDLGSAFFGMMRLQFGMMAGAAKCMTETSRAVETFLDSMAEETDFKNSEDLGDLMGRLPDAMVTASREAIVHCETIPEEMMDAFRRYSNG